MKSQITTKRGDGGESTALSGDDYSKGHVLMECVGTVDELRAHLALTRLLVLEERPEGHEATADMLRWLLHACFAIGASCSDPLNRRPQFHDTAIGPKHIQRLEIDQARIEEQVTLPRAFVVSASSRVSAQLDVTCTVARRFERTVVRLKEHFPDFDAADILVFVNRLSDYLFMLARHMDGGRFDTVDYGLLK